MSPSPSTFDAAEHYELAQWMSVQGVLVSAVLYYLVYQLTRILQVRPPKFFRGLDAENRTLFRTGLTSYIHSIVSGVWSTYVVVTTPKLLAEIHGYADWQTLAMTAMSCGYFLMDLLLMLAKRTFLDTPFLIVHVHHVLVGMALWLTLRFNHGLSTYMVMSLVCEVNNWFLHGGKLLRKMGVTTDSTLYAVNDVLFLLTFFAFRLLPHVYACTTLHDRNCVPVLWQWCVALFCSHGLALLDVLMILQFAQSRLRMHRERQIRRQVANGNGTANGAAADHKKEK